jgi:hypothetical protein
MNQTSHIYIYIYIYYLHTLFIQFFDKQSRSSLQCFLRLHGVHVRPPQSISVSLLSLMLFITHPVILGRLIVLHLTSHVSPHEFFEQVEDLRLGGSWMYQSTELTIDMLLAWLNQYSALGEYGIWVFSYATPNGPNKANCPCATGSYFLHSMMFL